jgi:hypothetical protein
VRAATTWPRHLSQNTIVLSIGPAPSLDGPHR